MDLPVFFRNKHSAATKLRKFVGTCAFNPWRNLLGLLVAQCVFREGYLCNRFECTAPGFDATAHCYTDNQLVAILSAAATVLPLSPFRITQAQRPLTVVFLTAFFW